MFNIYFYKRSDGRIQPTAVACGPWTASSYRLENSIDLTRGGILCAGLAAFRTRLNTSGAGSSLRTSSPEFSPLAMSSHRIAARRSTSTIGQRSLPSGRQASSHAVMPNERRSPLRKMHDAPCVSGYFSDVTEATTTNPSRLGSVRIIFK